MRTPWIGIDFDGTLAYYDGWKGPEHFGEPIPAMVERVKAWLANGITVKIFTARVGPGQHEDAELARIIAEKALHDLREWSARHIGVALEATCVKDNGMRALYDDRAFRVLKNTGRLCCEQRPS